MLRKLFFFLYFFLFCLSVMAQRDSVLPKLNDTPGAAITSDTTVKTTARRIAKPDSSILARDSSFIKDSLAVADSLLKDSLMREAVLRKPKVPLTLATDTAFQHLLRPASLFKKTQPQFYEGEPRIPYSSEYLFALLLGILLLVALIRQLFPKYLNDVFGLLFQASFRQKQKREQLMQEQLPSLLTNLLFVICGGLFIALLSRHYNIQLASGNVSFWMMLLYCIVILSLVYLVKFFVIRFMGWVFHAKEPASLYTFLVFLINKILGVALLPLLMVLAFSTGTVWEVTETIAFALVIVLFLFRYIISLSVIRNAIRVSPFHFFIYLCGVEIIPVLILYKLVFDFFRL